MDRRSALALVDAPRPAQSDPTDGLIAIGVLIAVAAALAIVVGGGLFLLIRMTTNASKARLAQQQARWAYLVNRFGPEAATKIVQGSIWQGQTGEMLGEALGRPAAVDRDVMKTKTVEIWKYHQVARGRFQLKVKLENGVVFGWDKKG